MTRSTDLLRRTDESATAPALPLTAARRELGIDVVPRRRHGLGGLLDALAGRRHVRRTQLRRTQLRHAY